MKKTIKIITIIVLIILILGVLFFINAFVGNPISKMIISKNSGKYIEENYAELELKSEVGYSFKTTNYFVRVYSEDIEDLHFTLYYDMFGNLTRDLYENNITNGWNVLERLNEDYRLESNLIFDELKNSTLFLNSDNFFSSAFLMSKIEAEERIVGFENNGGGIDGTKLELDKEYNVKELAKIGGVIDIDVSFSDGDVSYEQGAKALREIRATFDEAGIGFYYINFGVFDEEGNYAYRIDYFPYNEIYSEELIEKIKIAHENNPVNYH